MINSLIIRVNLDWVDRAQRRLSKWWERRERRRAFQMSVELDQRARIWRAEADECERDADRLRRVAAGGTS